MTCTAASSKGDTVLMHDACALARAGSSLAAARIASSRNATCSTFSSRRARTIGPVTRALRHASMGATAAAETATSTQTRMHFEDVIVTNSRTTDMAHTLWRAVMRPGDTVVDATMGNGWDTVALARILADLDASPAGDASKPGRVVAFDVQEDALTSTRARVRESLTPDQASRVDLVLKSHERMEEHVRVPGLNAFDDDDDDDDDGEDAETDAVGVVCFNLGYLPGPTADKGVRTRRTTTVSAVASGVRVLRPGGVLTVVGYTGHEGGWEEVEAVMELVSSLDPREFTATNHSVVNRDNCPQLIAVHRKETK